MFVVQVELTGVVGLIVTLNQTQLPLARDVPLQLEPIEVLHAFCEKAEVAASIMTIGMLASNARVRIFSLLFINIKLRKLIFRYQILTDCITANRAAS